MLKYGIVCYLVGGIYYVYIDFGLGYCMVNDLVFISEILIKSGEVINIFIFDLDVY